MDIFVGEQLRRIRTVRDISQQKLADKIGITFQQIQKYERGYNRISAGRLWKFYQILEFSVTAFYPCGVSNDMPALTHPEQNLLAHLRKADMQLAKAVTVILKRCCATYQRAKKLT